MIAPEDCTLYERWLESRDGDAFAELARRHAGVVYDLAVRYSGDAVLAEDLVQEALLDLALAGSRKPIDVGIVAWMARFAMCRARNVRASERARRKRQQTVGERRREDQMPDDRVERQDELQRALERAEPDERVVLAMRYLHGWEYGRIASALSISEGAARVRVHRALGALRSRLGVDVETAAATNGRTDGLAVVGAPLIGMLGDLGVHRMPDGLLEMGVRHAVETATAATGGAHVAPRVGRLTLQALGLTALVGAATAVSLTASAATGAFPGVEGPVALVARADPGRGDEVASGARGPLADRSGGVPRPPRWDEDALRRVGPPDGGTPPARGDSPAGAVPPESSAPSEPLPSDRPVGVLRPISRDACAATRAPVSSEDERAGNPGGRLPSLRAPAEPGDAAAVRERAPGLPATLHSPDPAHDAPSVRLVDRALRPLGELEPEQAQLVNEAATLVARLVAAEGVDTAELVVNRRLLREQTKQLRKEYRRARRALRRAVAEDNHGAFAAETARAAQVASAQQILKLLLNFVLADGRTAGELAWPDGADVTAALLDVVDTLSTLFPDGAAGDPPGGAPATTGEVLPDGAGG